MPLPINPPIVVAAVPQKTFDQWFFPDFCAANLQDDARCTLTFKEVPQNATTKEFLWSDAKTYSGNFWDIYSNVEGAKEVMDSVIALLPAIKAYLTPEATLEP